MDFAITETQSLFRDTIVDFARAELNREIRENDRDAIFPAESWKKCADMGLLSLLTPKEHNGLGEDLASTSLSVMALSYGCEDGGLVHAIVTQLCCIQLINHYGTDSQKAAWLGRLSSGEAIGAQGITEPDAGSDVLSMRTKATRTENGYSISGSKTFISNGPIADLVVVFAKNDASKSVFGNLSAFLLESGSTGYETGRPLEKMGLRTLQNSELFFDDVQLPDDAVLGKHGNGMFIFNEGLEWERILMAAAHLGTLERIIDRCVEYAKNRKQFGTEIGKYQSVAHKISDMKVGFELGKLIMGKAAWLKDSGKRATLEASVAKLFVSETLKKSCLDAAQIHGGYGFMSDYPIERELRDSIASTIYSGTSEMQRNIIAGMLGL